MKVLLAGASGAIGIPLTCELISHGHQVLGLTRTQGNASQLVALGATPVVADAAPRDSSPNRSSSATAIANMGR
jgi:nucleoside-diphosphate-sugar epimerase